MRLALVVLLVIFSDYLPALTAFVVDASALDFMHAVLVGFYLALTVLTLLGLLCFNHLNY